MDKKIQNINIQINKHKNPEFELCMEDTDNFQIIKTIINNESACIIQSVLSKQKLNCRLLHESFMEVAQMAQIDFVKILITNIYYAQIIGNQEKKKVAIDVRLSDAVILSLKYQIPIYYVVENFLPQYQGMIEKNKDIHEYMDNLTTSLSQFNLVQLEALLKIVVEKEDFESASLIRDEIKLRRLSY